MQSPAEICFEDFAPGQVTTFGSRLVEKDEIIAFAEAFDPQPFHVSEAAAKTSFAGGLIASGWHTNAIMNRMNCDEYFNRSSCIGSPGIDEVKWLRPVRPGDRLTMRRTILEAVPSRSRPDRGMVRFANDLFNQHGEPVCHHNAMVLFLRREPGGGNGQATGSETRTPMDILAPVASADHDGKGDFFEDIVVGEIRTLGQYAFDADAIRRFALAYDNQRFHIDDAAAEQTHFGGIVASGWHTGAAWMRTMVLDRQRRRDIALARGQAVAQLGVSPGVRKIRFLQPVRPGDTLTYISRIAEKRLSTTRPGWGVVVNDNQAINQNGALVFSFTGSVFWEARQP